MIQYTSNIDKELKRVRDDIEIIGSALQTEMTSKDSSVEAVITQEILSDILYLLEGKNYIGCLFTVAPVLRALTIGKISSFTPTKNNKMSGKTIYFNENYEYNLIKLNNYVKSLEKVYYGNDTDGIDGYVNITKRLNKLKRC